MSPRTFAMAVASKVNPGNGQLSQQTRDQVHSRMKGALVPVLQMHTVALPAYSPEVRELPIHAT